MYEAILNKLKEVLPKTNRYEHEVIEGEPLSYVFNVNDSDLYLVLCFESYTECEYSIFISLVRDFYKPYSHELVVFADEVWPVEEIEAYLEHELMTDYKHYTKLINSLDKKFEYIAQLLESQPLEVDYDVSF